ncbi:MAG: Crp/Fnr family transcriptional regulator [Roseovarius sp.]
MTFRKGGTVQFEGDKSRSVYCVLEGWLVMSKALSDGQNQIIDFAMPGDIVDPAGADGRTSVMNIGALTDGSVAAMPRRIWTQMINTWPTLQRRVYLTQAAKQARYNERLLRLGKGPADMRIAYALLEFAMRLRAIKKDSVSEFRIPMTQQQLGDYVGLCSVHVCRTLRRLMRNGIIDMRKQMHIKVLDLDALGELARAEHEGLKNEIMPIRL